MDLFIFKTPLFKRLMIGAAVLIALMIFSPVACVSSTQRGVRVRFGAVLDGVIRPGLVVKVPIIERIDTYSITPVAVPIKIPAADNGAITADNQTIGLAGMIYYRLDEARMDEVARNYTSGSLSQIAEANAESSVKSVIGNYTIFDLAANQVIIAGKAMNLLASNVKQYPIIVVDTKITNYTWSDDFDKQIKETMKRAQEVKQKDQELLVTQVESQKQVKQAEAAKQATVLAAEAQRDKAKLDAEAKVLEGEGIRKYNQAIAVNWDIEFKKTQLEIERARVEKWDGHYVPNNRYGPIPVDTKGGVQGE